MLVLGIETSCDETSAAVVQSDGRNFSVLSNVVSSQIKTHAKYGGVVPEVAARIHVEAILPVIEKAFGSGGMKKIDAIAVASGPGLITSLLVGNEVARILSWFLKKPLVGLNHIEAHIYANWLMNKKMNFPALCLVVSGGHTELILMCGHGKYEVIGETRDDAAGECFDKAAKILGLGYPGGPAVAAAAENFVFASIAKQSHKDGIAASPRQGGTPRNDIRLPRPMMDSPDFDFSFSGLKTAVLYAARDLKNKYKMEKIIPAMAHEVQEAIVDVLLAKTIRAAKKYNVKTVMLAGGVSANKSLRERFVAAMEKELPSADWNIPDFKYCTDNAAMVAAAGYFHVAKKDFTPWRKLKVDPNWEL
ncbi:tRNA (adenosine(37)-N6)-threonylcarbamoyltransferase complex transferase subunit TsaD, partial [Patescibacteria group bacterium]|nr:tRNA (adenosine(37)-N6)-threonylcarbamoyltransferase complex transferase subunit TsaD [Patescibacteria group bacterium]